MYVFALLLFVGYGASRELVVEDMYFYRIDHCNAMASFLVKDTVLTVLRLRIGLLRIVCQRKLTQRKVLYTNTYTFI